MSGARRVRGSPGKLRALGVRPGYGAPRKHHVSAMELSVKLPNFLTVLRLAVALDCKVMDLVGEVRQPVRPGTTSQDPASLLRIQLEDLAVQPQVSSCRYRPHSVRTPLNDLLATSELMPQKTSDR